MSWKVSVNGRAFTTLDAVRLFWPNVRRDVGYTSDRSVADRSRFTRDAIIERLTTSERWLYPDIFDARWEEGFDFLDPTEKEQLLVATVRVREVAAEMSGGVRPTLAQLVRARQPFTEVVELMGFDRYEEADDFFLGKTVERRLAPNWPPQLDHLRFRSGLDSTDDPALWVWAFVAESGEFDDDRFLAQAKGIETVLGPVAREVAPEGRVYLHFRSTLDLPERQEVAA